VFALLFAVCWDLWVIKLRSVVWLGFTMFLMVVCFMLFLVFGFGVLVCLGYVDLLFIVCVLMVLFRLLFCR